MILQFLLFLVVVYFTVAALLVIWASLSSEYPMPFGYIVLIGILWGPIVIERKFTEWRMRR